MIPFSPPRIDQQIIDEVIHTLRSGWITTGPKTKLFEQKLAEYCGVDSVLCLNSATAGLELVLRWFGVQEGDEVIVPVYTYAATANVVIHCGAKPVFVDVNRQDFNISLEAIEKAVTEKTKVIMPVDFAGFPCDYETINALVKSEGIKNRFKARTVEQEKLGRILVLSDAAHSMGALYKGKKAGSFTDVSVFSFHAVKNLSTAEGGAVALNLPGPFQNEEVYKVLCVKSLHGQNKDALAKMQKGNWRYDIVEPGYKCNMTDIMASIGLVELGRYDADTLVKRRKIFDTYTAAFSGYTWAELPAYATDEKRSSYHLYPLRIKGINEQKRDAIIREISNRNVSVNVHFIPVTMMTYYASLGYRPAHTPVACDNYSREISLPVFYDLTSAQMKTVVSAVTAAVASVTEFSNV